MKKRKIMFIKSIILTILFISITLPCHASQEEILQSQSETLNIKEFVSQANKYTQDVFDGIDVGKLLSEAIGGKIDNQTIFTKILNLFGKEIKDTLKIIRKYYCDYHYS